MPGKPILFAILLALCLTLCGSAAVVAQQGHQSQTDAGTREEAVVSSWVKDILGRGCPQPAQAVTQTKDPFPDDIQMLLLAWLDYSIFWRRVYWAVSIGTILFGALAAALTDGGIWFTKWKTTAALLVTVIAGMNTTFSPYSVYQKFDDAFAVLNSTKIAYVTNPTVTLCDVGKAVLYGESIIHRGG